VLNDLHWQAIQTAESSLILADQISLRESIMSVSLVARIQSFKARQTSRSRENPRPFNY